MKRFSFLPMVVLAALLVAVASCSTPMGASGGAYEEAPVQGNVYYADPYLGGLNTIIVERDPYTGRYYQVSPGYYGGGGVYTPAYPYYGGRGYYGGGGSRRYANPNYNNRNYNNRNYTTPQGNNGYYRNYPQAQQRQQPVQQSPVQRPQMQQQRNEAKDAILGPKRRN